MVFGCGKNENDMSRRLLQCFQQGVEGFARQHMHFINDIYFVFGGSGCKFDIFPQFPDFINATIGGAVYFTHVERRTVCNFDTIGADIAGIGRRPFFAIE